MTGRRDQAATVLLTVAVIVPVLREHLAVFAEDDPGALVFPGAKGGPLRRGNFNKMSAWPQAVESLALSGLHSHDLRHAGNHFAARSGAGAQGSDGPLWGTTANGPR